MAQKANVNNKTAELFSTNFNEGRIKLPEKVFRDRISLTKDLIKSVSDAAW